MVPAINRAARELSILVPPAGVSLPVAEAALRELGYHVRRYRGEDLRARLFTWARRAAERYPGRTLLVTTSGRPGHAVVVADGRVYDNHTPRGTAGRDHPFAHALVDYVALVERRS